MTRVEGKKVALVVDNYFEQAEFTEPKRLLEQAGVSVDVLSPQSGVIRGMEHAELADEFRVDKPLSQADFNTYHALLLPGGAINADTLRMDSYAQRIVRSFMSEGKPVAAICHAPWVLVSAGLADGKTMTSFPTIRDDITNAGGTWVDREVCVDGNLITSRNPGDIPAFTQALLDMLEAR